MNLKVLIVVGAVLVVVLLGSTLFGITQGASAPDDLSPDWLNVLQRTGPLAGEDIARSQPDRCARQFIDGSITLAPGATCTLTVRASNSLIPESRDVTFRLTEGAQVNVAVRQPDIVTEEEEIQTGEEESFRVLSDGGSVAIDCLSPGAGASCVIEVSE